MQTLAFLREAHVFLPLQKKKTSSGLIALVIYPIVVVDIGGLAVDESLLPPFQFLLLSQPTQMIVETGLSHLIGTTSKHVG